MSTSIYFPPAARFTHCVTRCCSAPNSLVCQPDSPDRGKLFLMKRRNIFCSSHLPPHPPPPPPLPLSGPLHTHRAFPGTCVERVRRAEHFQFPRVIFSFLIQAGVWNPQDWKSPKLVARRSCSRFLFAAVIEFGISSLWVARRQTCALHLHIKKREKESVQQTGACTSKGQFVQDWYLTGVRSMQFYWLYNQI